MQEICIIIPCYNEELRFHSEALASFLQINKGFSFLLVNDGSTDNTLSLLQQLAERYPQKVHVLHFDNNSGKGEAIRKAVLHTASQEYNYIGFLDADFSAPPGELLHIIAYFDGILTKSFIAGSRIKRLGADVTRNSFRHYAGRVFATAAAFVLKLPVYDSQCGLKIIKKELAAPLFTEPFVSKWLFDLELLLRLRNHLGTERTRDEAIEIPLREWHGKKGSKLSLADLIRVPFELLRIHFKYNR